MCRVLALSVMATVVLLAATSARAADCSPDASQPTLDVCALEDLRRADASLHALFDRMMQEPALSGRLDRLQASEQAWAAYRDAECRFEDSWAEGGSMQPMLNSDCAKLLTERRIADLTAALSCVHDSNPGNCRSP